MFDGKDSQLHQKNDIWRVTPKALGAKCKQVANHGLPGAPPQVLDAPIVSDYYGKRLIVFQNSGSIYAYDYVEEIWRKVEQDPSEDGDLDEEQDVDADGDGEVPPPCVGCLCGCNYNYEDLIRKANASERGNSGSRSNGGETGILIGTFAIFLLLALFRRRKHRNLSR